MQIILNSLGLLLGFGGTLLVFFFGLPSIEILNSGAYVETEVTPAMQRYVARSRPGLVLIALAFLLQFVALFVKA